MKAIHLLKTGQFITLLSCLSLLASCGGGGGSGSSADNTEDRYPLLIVNHGWGSSKRFDTSGTMALMDFHPIVVHVASEIFDRASPLIILSPQRCWSDVNDPQIDILNAFVEWAVRNYPIDTNRIYMTGLSAGGWATWEYARLYPGVLAAAAPMAAGGAIYEICPLVQTPIWAFSALDDESVPYTHVVATVDALLRCETDVEVVTPKLTLFETGGHVINDNIYDQSFLNMGDPAYDIFDQSIFDWFLTHELTQNQQ